MRWQRWIILGCIMVLATGCDSPFRANFVPEQLDMYYPPVDAKQVTVHRVGAQHPEEVQQRLYPEAIIVGTSAFDSTSASSGELEKLAGELGADVVIWSSILTDTVVYTDFQRIPHTTRTKVRVKEGDQITRTRITTESTEIVPRTTVQDYYRHFALFLRQ